MFKHNKYTEAIFKEFEQGTGNISISAKAGSGKTTTIVECLKLIPPNKRVVFCAFNNSIVDELRERCPTNIFVTTLHSLGWGALKRFYGSDIKLNQSKSYMYAEKMFKYVVGKRMLPFHCSMLSKLVELYRLNLVDSRQELIDLADKHDIYYDDLMLDQAEMLLEVVSSDTSQFDFTDMLFVPAILDDIKLMSFDYIFVDECQDLNRAQQELLLRSRKRGARLISVGDPNQAIYGFAGADVDSFNRLANLPKTTKLPLSVCYRCATSIVEKAQEIVEDIEPAPGAIRGEVRNGSIAEIKNEDWVLCRNVRPLIILCVDLISRNKKAHVVGAEIGKSIINLLKKTGQSNYSKAKKSLSDMLDKTKDELRKRGVIDPLRHPKYVNLAEKVSVINYLGQNTTSTSVIIAKLEKIFKQDTKGIRLSTIHKAKGLENDRVFLICPELIPSKYATQPWQLEQESNLAYVAYTRAKKSLVIVDDFKDSVVDYRTINKSKDA